MSASRGVRFALLGLALFLAAALALTWLATEPASGPGGDPIVEAVPAPVVAPLPLPVLPESPTPSPPPPESEPRVAGPRVAPAPSATPWPEVTAVARVTALGALGGPLHAGLEAARDRMEYCFAEERRRLEGRPPPRPPPGDPPGGPAALVLRLETGPGVVEIVDTEVEYLATSTPELVECCRRALRAVEIPAAAAVAGRRYRLKYLLQ